MSIPPEPRHPGLNPKDERWGQRFSAVMLGVCLVIIAVLLVIGSRQ